MLLALLMPVLGLEGGPDEAGKFGFVSTGALPSPSEGTPGVDALDGPSDIGGGMLELL